MIKEKICLQRAMGAKGVEKYKQIFRVMKTFNHRNHAILDPFGYEDPILEAWKQFWKRATSSCNTFI
jgi:hypothetical protein